MSDWSYVNPMTTQFRAQDLNDSTFAYSGSTDNNPLSLPNLAREFSQTSLQANVVELDNTGNTANNVPGPFSPTRGLSNVDMSLSGLNDLSGVNLANYDFSVPENFMTAVQASNTNSDQFAMAMNFPSMNPNEFNFMTNNITNQSLTNNVYNSSAVYNNSTVNANTNITIKQQQSQDEPNRKRARPVVDIAPVQPQSQLQFPNSTPNGSRTTSSNSTSDQLQSRLNNAFPSIPPSNNSNNQSPDSDTENATMFDSADKETQKKLKHQLTDRQRRAKIKENMDALKALVTVDPNQKADQATIVANSVQLLRDKMSEVEQLRAEIQALKLGSGSPHSPLAEFAYRQQSIASPYTSLMASLNGAGVAMWRVGLDGKLQEVNMVFEMISGYSSSELSGKSVCAAPLHGSLSIMPQSFLRHFSTVSSLISPAAIFPQSPQASSNTTSSNNSTASGDDSPYNPARTFSSDTATTAKDTNTDALKTPNLFGNTLSQLPVMPQSELQDFFPPLLKARMDLNDQPMNPQPHGTYLINHLANLPPNHVLKLLSRVNTSWGETLEAIVTISLVRTPNGQPDHVICLSTPDCRRLVKQTNFVNKLNINADSYMNKDVCQSGLMLKMDPKTLNCTSNIAPKSFSSAASPHLQAWN